MQALHDILKQAQTSIEAANDLKALENCRVNLLGKKSELTALLKSLGQLPPEERKEAGQAINKLKEDIHLLLEAREKILQQQEVASQLSSETIDVTLPGTKENFGTLHPITLTIDNLKHIFGQMGFIFMTGPEIEDDYHNFEALNIPPLHPARAMQDTFYFEDQLLLRTQMSPIQIRAMKTLPLPLKIAAMGRVYRRDFDLTHTPMFHQMEGLVIDKNITFSELKGLLHDFICAFFNKDIKLKFRPSYFPFTEPSAEVDITCLNCSGSGCRICKQSGWLEILGCGMVHPNVLKSVGINSEENRGFAFGLGLDRLAMLKYGISDLRSLFENDLRFLKQF